MFKENLTKTEIAFKFNNNLSSVAQGLKSNIPFLPDEPTFNVKMISSFVFLDTDSEEFRSIIVYCSYRGTPIDEVRSSVYKKNC